MAGEVPHEYYMSNDPPQVKDYMESANIIAGAGGWKKLKFKVDEVNSILKYIVINSRCLHKVHICFSKVGVYN